MVLLINNILLRKVGCGLLMTPVLYPYWCHNLVKIIVLWWKAYVRLKSQFYVFFQTMEFADAQAYSKAIETTVKNKWDWVHNFRI